MLFRRAVPTFSPSPLRLAVPYQVLAAISGDLAEDSAGPAQAPVVKKIGLKLGGAPSAAPKNKSTANLLDASVFGENDDSASTKTRTIIPLDYTGMVTPDTIVMI